MPLLENTHSSQWQTWKNFLHYRSKTILWCFLIFLFCEGTLFNLPYWKTRTIKPELYTSTQLTVNSSLEKTNDGLRIIKTDPKPAITISTTDRSLRYANFLVNKNTNPKQVFWYSIITYYNRNNTPHGCGGGCSFLLQFCGYISQPGVFHKTKLQCYVRLSLHVEFRVFGATFVTF